jgi:hypothetical protein
MTKVCHRCKIEKDETEFHIRKERKSGRFGTCKKCRNRAYWLAVKNNPERKRKANKYSNDWGRKNPKRVNECSKRWNHANPDKVNAGCSNYRARKLQATPPWLTQAMKTDIQFFYTIREQMKNPSAWHIDHVVPLMGETARGLHVPWNLQLLPAPENMSKHNKLTA